MDSIKSDIEAKMRTCYDTISFYKLYSDILPEDIGRFISDLTTQLYILELQYNEVCYKFFLEKTRMQEQAILDLSKMNLHKMTLAAFKQTCKKFNLSVEKINELKKKRRQMKNRFYAKKRRDKIKAMHDE